MPCKKKLAFYIRLSLEDFDLKTSDKTESNSVSNQRKLLQDYYDSHPELKEYEIIEFCEDGEMPPSIANIIDVDPVSGNFVSKKYPDVKIGSIDDILDRYEYVNMMDDVEDSE